MTREPASALAMFSQLWVYFPSSDSLIIVLKWPQIDPNADVYPA